MYNTETAKEIGKYVKGYDDSACHETLYKKRTGEYFLYGEGGPASAWAEPVEGNAGVYASGEDIRPLTYDQAKDWFIRANNDDDSLATDKMYNHEFGKPKKDEPKEITSIALSRTAKRKLERMATKQGIPQSEIIENLILSE